MAVAATYSDIATKIVGNAGGSVQQLNNVNVQGGKERVDIATITLASQASGSLIMLTRLPMYAAWLGATLITNTSLVSSTISIGNTNNASLYAPAATLTSTNTMTPASNTAKFGDPITAGYDATTGNEVTAYRPGQGGAIYDDIVANVGVAALPASGTLKVAIRYMLD
jgi:hypothetical protein